MLRNAGVEFGRIIYITKVLTYTKQASLHFPGINKLSRLNKKKKRRKRRRRKRKKNKNKKKYSQIEKMDLNKFM